MDYQPLNPTPTHTIILGDATAGPSLSFPRPHTRQGGPDVLRFRGIMLNATTGMVMAQGQPVMLATVEREALAALMRRAGQIVSKASLARQMHVSADEVEVRMDRLTTAMRDAGSRCLPRQVDGLGFILWP